MALFQEPLVVEEWSDVLPESEKRVEKLQNAMVRRKRLLKIWSSSRMWRERPPTRQLIGGESDTRNQRSESSSL